MTIGHHRQMLLRHFFFCRCLGILMDLRVDFSHESTGFQLSKRDRCVQKVVVPAKALLGVGINDVPPPSGWSTKNISLDDPAEVALAGKLLSFALALVAASTSHEIK